MGKGGFLVSLRGKRRQSEGSIYSERFPQGATQPTLYYISLLGDGSHTATVNEWGCRPETHTLEEMGKRVRVPSRVPKFIPSPPQKKAATDEDACTVAVVAAAAAAAARRGRRLWGLVPVQNFSTSAWIQRRCM